MSKTQEKLPHDHSELDLPKTTTKPVIDGRSPFGMNRKFRRALFASVRSGSANANEVERFKSLGKDAYPWMSFRDVIEGMKSRSVPKSKHVKPHKWQKVDDGSIDIEIEA
jgi:hypothetical protein